MNRRWVRVYADILDDPKVAQMSAKSFKFFIFLLVFCAESDIGDRISDDPDSICWRFRITKKAYNEAIKELLVKNIICFENNNLIIKNWSKRQYASDNSTERVKRFRNRRETLHETPPDTETDTETDTEKKIIIKESFKKFYSAYPRKKSQDRAEATFAKITQKQKIKTQEQLDKFTNELISAINLQKTEYRLKTEAGQEMPPWRYPSTWLNDGGWKDEVDLKTQKPKPQNKPNVVSDYMGLLRDEAKEEELKNAIN